MIGFGQSDNLKRKTKKINKNAKEKFSVAVNFLKDKNANHASYFNDAADLFSKSINYEPNAYAYLFRAFCDLNYVPFKKKHQWSDDFLDEYDIFLLKDGLGYDCKYIDENNISFFNLQRAVKDLETILNIDEILLEDNYRNSIYSHEIAELFLKPIKPCLNNLKYKNRNGELNVFLDSTYKYVTSNDNYLYYGKLKFVEGVANDLVVLYYKNGKKHLECTLAKSGFGIDSYKIFSENGFIKEEGTYDLESGRAVNNFHKNQRKIKSKDFTSLHWNLLKVPTKIYNENGNLIKEYNFLKHKGYAELIKEFDDDGKINFEIVYGKSIGYNNKIKFRKFYYENGNPKLIWKQLESNNSKFLDRIHNLKKDEFFENGNLKKTINYPLFKCDNCKHKHRLIYKEVIDYYSYNNAPKMYSVYIEKSEGETWYPEMNFNDDDEKLIYKIEYPNNKNNSQEYEDFSLFSESNFIINNTDIRNINEYNLEDFIYLFLDECKLNGIKIDEQKIDIWFNSQLTNPTIAIAVGMNQDSRISVEVNPSEWKSSSVTKKLYIMYHELGHDVFNLEHGQGGKMMFCFAERDYSWTEFFIHKRFMFDYIKSRQK